MTKKSRKYRKARIRLNGDTPSASKENSFSNMFCRKGDFRMKTVDAAIRSCPAVNKKQKNAKKDDSGLHKQSQGSSGLKKKTGLVSLISWKISSVSFFIPLNSHDHGYHEVSSETLIDWSNLLFYRCKSTAMLSYYPNEQVRKMYFIKPTVLPELRLKCRTLSESSTNSEDSLISFEHDDTCDNARNLNSVKSNRRSLKKSRRKISVECDESSSREELGPKKKVRFEDESQLVTIHRIVAWDYAYRAARVSPWMTVARDAKRFKQKIHFLEPVLSPVLNPEHRARIYEARIKS